MSALPESNRARIAEFEREFEPVEKLARALFLAEHPGSEWSAGRARMIWFSRAQVAIDFIERGEHR